jgi:GDPmannose 4,6-dehydratase
MLQQDKPEDYVIGTGEKHSVRDFFEAAAEAAGLELHSNGEQGINEKYLNQNGNTILEINPEYFRPKEINTRLADITKANQQLNWKPKTMFKELVKKMVDADLKTLKQQHNL